MNDPPPRPNAKPRRHLQWFVSPRWFHASDMAELRAAFPRAAIIRLALITVALVAGLYFVTTRYFPAVASEVRWSELMGGLFVYLVFMAALCYGLTWCPRIITVTAQAIVIQHGQSNCIIPWQSLCEVSIEHDESGRRILRLQRIDRRPVSPFSLPDRISNDDFADFLRGIGRSGLLAVSAGESVGITRGFPR
jgi:hypothetical protein